MFQPSTQLAVVLALSAVLRCGAAFGSILVPQMDDSVAASCKPVESHESPRQEREKNEQDDDYLRTFCPIQGAMSSAASSHGPTSVTLLPMISDALLVPKLAIAGYLSDDASLRLSEEHRFRMPKPPRA